MKKSKFLIVCLIALLMAGGLALYGCDFYNEWIDICTAGGDCTPESGCDNGNCLQNEAKKCSC
jgi:hypothetical protein